VDRLGQLRVLDDEPVGCDPELVEVLDLLVLDVSLSVLGNSPAIVTPSPAIQIAKPMMLA